MNTVQNYQLSSVYGNGELIGKAFYGQICHCRPNFEIVSKKDQDQDPLDIYEQYAQIPSQPLMFGKTW